MPKLPIDYISKKFLRVPMDILMRGKKSWSLSEVINYYIIIVNNIVTNVNY